jgi:hypothetical protein
MTSRDRQNTSETEIDGARFVSEHRLVNQPELVEGLIVVSGPDVDDDICLLGAREVYLPRATAIRLVEELCRRLKVSVTTGGQVVEGPRPHDIEEPR